MTETRIKISSIVENQLPQFVLEEFPLVSEFLSQYYTSLESQGSVSDILQNIDKYVKVDLLTNLIESTTLTSDVAVFDSTINVSSTSGFPDSYGLLLIDSEIITYTSKTATSFEGCVRGFSGVTSYKVLDELTFSESQSAEHLSSAKVTNLSILFLKEFLVKIKKQVTPGFENRELYSSLNENLFIKQSIDFYSSKGTDNSFKILFGALYGTNVEVIKPRDYLIKPSNAQYRITSDLVVEAIQGNPENLVNGTLYQDKSNFTDSAQGTITKVEKIRRGSNDYYVISLDSDYSKDIGASGTVYGNFNIHPKTKTIVPTVVESTTIEVDSTVGFPKTNGNLVIDLENGTTLNVTYTSKTLNQFLGCRNITQNIPVSTEIKTNFFAYGYDSNETVKVRILGVLSELDIPIDTRFYSKNDEIKIKTLGIDLKDYKSNNWFFNIPTKYEVNSVELLDISDKTYKVNLYEDHYFKIGDSVTLLSSSDVEKTGFVVSFNNEKSFSVQLGSEVSPLDTSFSYTVRKNVSKVTTENYPSVNQYTSNVQNIYYEDENSLYVSSPSLPTYLNQTLKITDRSVVFSGTFDGTTLDIGKHGFYTGDSIVYKPTSSTNLGIATGIYFIKKLSETQVKLSKSRSNIFAESFISVKGTVTNAKFELANFTYKDLSTQLLESQKLIRKISTPENDDNYYETAPGLTGILVNGVEVLNYKSKDNVYFGPIQKIVTTSPGSGYDIINPPVLNIVDPVGSGATAYCSIVGGLERIDIIDPGFDYLEDPIIDISGGNGSNAHAVANLIGFDYSVSFNSQASAGLVKINPTNQIGFSSYHKFRNAEEIIYITDGQSSVGGLTTNSTYYASIQDAYSIKLHKSFEDAVSGINTIQINSYGVGNHSFRSKNKKKKIGSITVENSGTNYQNKLVTTNVSGINTALDVITVSDHGYQSGEIIVYNSTGNSIGGLSSSSSYFVTKINDNQFKLSEVGISSLGVTTSFYYDTNQYVDLTSTGTGIHKFNYPEIKVTISGKIGVSTLSGQNFNAVIQPVFRGQVQSVFVESGGQEYGSEEIINYNRQPLFELESGEGSELEPIVFDGKIVDVLIKNPGSGYNSPPDLKINGDGVGASVVPVIKNGSLVEVKVLQSGIGYSQKNTTLDVIPAGSNAKLEAKIKTWKINLIERAIQNSQVSDDDGILESGLNSDYGLEYTHGYAPRKLRSSVQSTSFREGKRVYTPDLQLLDGKEINSEAHSPIIGWAYDGNPIYGPYGYSSKTGGSVKSLVSGYHLVLSEDRPRTSFYPQGFFVEDYSYFGDGDLDENNGRFGVTPEYPNGVYAYFATINGGSVESSGLFVNYKKPAFPYIIGPSYKSKPIEFNFRSDSNQDSIDINQTGWRRNTTPYNISSYNYLFNPNAIKPQNSIVKSTYRGSIDSVGIESGGKNYKVNDRIVFDSSSGYGANAVVSFVKGKNVNQISVATSTFENVQFYPYNQEFIGFTSVPHNYLDNELITFTGKYDYKKSGRISVGRNNLSLIAGVGSAQYTGIVTYFRVYGSLNYSTIKENDIYQIGNEQVKVLNIDPQSSRIRVLRNQNGTTGVSSYSAGTALTEKTRRLVLNFGISTSYNFDTDREIYFDPKESVGLGNSVGVGIVSTIYFSNPGVGITQLTIPTQTIYLRSHNLETGDSLTYSSNGGTRISVSTDGSSSFQLGEKSIVYVAKISNDLIGISTVKVGLGSTGNFVSIGSSLESRNGVLYLTSVGTGSTHSFKTNYANTLVGKISKNTVTVSTAETHGLSLFDNVTVSVKSGLTTTFTINYNDYNRRLVINPRPFSSIDTTNSIIRIANHGYKTGQKVIYSSNTPATGLTNQEMYYVVVIDSDSVKLSSTYFDSLGNNPRTINITSSTAGTLSPINPPIDLIKNQVINFDLSDPSLSFINNSITYSAFDFKLYKDRNFKEEFDTSGSSSIFEVSKTGKVGIDSTARVRLTLNDNVPNTLYYRLVPVNTNLISDVKNQIINDDEVLSSNKLTLVESGYNGIHPIVGISSTTFNYNLLDQPEYSSYSEGVEYYTNSKEAYGSIHKISVLNGGNRYETIPGITTITSSIGSGAFLVPNSNSIGKISSTEIEDIGFEYPSDFSVRPTVKLPDVLTLESLSSFDYIGVSSFGRNYNSAPNLVAIDAATNKVIDDVSLTYNLGDSRVTIVKNTTSIGKIPPKIIPINNSNGTKISNISFNDTTKDVTVTLGATFSNAQDFPFVVGDKVLIEGISVGVGTTGKGYNSANYNYSLFTIKNTDPNIGGIGATVSYNLTGYLTNGEVPGTFDGFYSSGRIIAEDDFPIFNPVLKKNNFYEGETVYSSTASGNVVSWDTTNQFLKVSTTQDFEENQILRGKTSGSTAIIKNILTFDSNYKINSSSSLRKGWNAETGFLNNDLQRVHDSDYYQYFSYDLKSNVDLNTWDNPVSTLNHTAGFKKFGNLIIESTKNVGVSTDQNQGDFTGISDLSNVVSLNCTYDFDLARENNLIIDGNVFSDEIIFNSQIIQDYIESFGNKVLMIDDISDEFNSNPRATSFSIVDSFSIDKYRSMKYVIFVTDRKNSAETQISLLSLLHDDSFGFLNQYGFSSEKDLGFFDFNISGSSGNILFYPIKSKFNDYYTTKLSFSLNDITSGIGTLSLGDSVLVNTNTSTISTGTTSATTIVGIASTYRSSKILVQIGSTSTSYYEYDEITYVHNDSEVFLLDYGQLTTNDFTTKSTSGIGTYNAYISGGNVVIDLIPYTTIDTDYSVNTFNVSFASTISSGIGTQIVGGAYLDSSAISIASTSSPIANVISSYPTNTYQSSYSIISIEDKTNSEYEIFEFLTITDTINNKCYILEFGIGTLQTASSLGITTAGISGSNTNIYFTPLENIDVDVKSFQIALSLSDATQELSFNNGLLTYDYGSYVGTDNDIRKDFYLTYNNNPIFQKIFNAEDTNVVKTSTDTIRIPNHFFVTGEEIEYSYPGVGTTQAIGIATTSIAGIGTTDKLPATLYVVKVNDLDIKVSASSSDALKSIPNVLDLTSVGIGTSHTFMAKNQNEKSIITVDNLIQSPLTSTAVTTTLAKNVGLFDSQISVSGISSFFGGDLIKIDDEIMKVISVGIASTNSISVLRPWLGTGISTHASSTLTTKVLGNYNIVDNKIYFDEAPFGKVPILNPTNRPDEIDYIGIETGSTFSGRIFLRSGEADTVSEPYSKNYIFDDISNDFDGVDKTFVLKSNGSNVSGVSTDNAIVLINNIFQAPNAPGFTNNYSLNESAGITTITFTGNSSTNTFDVNVRDVPRGGTILSVGSTQGFGYQPLVAAGGTAIVSSAGTIQSISIGNSGSGYRVGIQTIVNVGVKTESLGTPNIEFIGTASVSNGHIVSVAITNPGVGYTSTNPPIVVFDSPLSYTNIPLIYSSQSSSGLGTGASVDIIVGQGSSVVSFELRNLGYAYKKTDILTVSIGGTAGIPTDTSLSFSEFQLTVDKTQSDNFAAWSVGRLQVIDPIDNLFDGNRTVFPILISGNQTTIRSRKGSNIDVQAALLIFINDVLQVPGQGYIFTGGSTIRFTEAPKQGDTSKILFYKGSGDLDTQTIDILETIKVGDKVTLKDDNISLSQDERLVTEIVSSDIINTNLYPGPGVSQDENLVRALTWCRQTEDLIVNESYVGKNRTQYEPYIQPTTNIIRNVGIASTSIFVESVKAFFDSEKEYIHDGTTEKPQNKIIIISQDSIVSASATATVSISGTISSIVVTDGGVGYTTSPTISISNPTGVGSTGRALATASIINGSVSSVSISTGGFGYSSSNPPSILFESPIVSIEAIDKVSYEGDFGVITGVQTTSVGVASTGLVFDFYIPNDSILRDSKIVKVGIATTGISGIQTGYYFTVNKSTIGSGITSLDLTGGIVGLGTTYINNIYQVAAVSIAQTAVPGVGITNVAKVTVSVSNYNGLSGFGFSSFYGEYSWGRILTPTRINPKQFVSYANIGGISTSPVVQRFNRLKYVGYSTS